MSFFGFDTSGHNKAAPGFAQAHDPFAGLGHDEDATALEFEDTYDGLGDQLDDGDDAFNDDTFGGGSTSVGNVGKDFDFFGQTATVAGVIDEEHTRFKLQHPGTRGSVSVPGYQQPAPKKPAPARSGYEKYAEPEPVSELQVDAALWGTVPKKQPAAAPAAAVPSSTSAATAAGPAGRKVMSLEEVEAQMMRQQAKKPAQPERAPVSTSQQHVPASAPQQQTGDFLYAQPKSMPPPVPSPSDHGLPHEAAAAFAQSHPQAPPVTILQRPQSKPSPAPGMGQPHAPFQPTQQHPQQMQGHNPRQQAAQHHQHPGPSGLPTQILQNPNRIPPFPSQPAHPGHHRQQSAHMMPQPPQLAHLSEEDRAAYLEQEARRAKRNHKIFMLSKDNGMMTPQDKNFITRIQLQQLVAATGNPIEQGSDDNITEDFYYQVHCQIRGSQRQHPGQPLSTFAQTYLYQTGSRQHGSRRQLRGPENHVQRMEQQVQRAVEAAKNKPKNKQLVIEGSLGKISFSNAKTPKPLLNIKRGDSNTDAAHHRPTSAGGKQHASSHSKVIDRKTVLADVEDVYSTLMQMEDHDRKMPPPTQSGGPDAEWVQEADRLNGQLWRALKVHEPIGATAVHPFIAFLSCAKGKKAIPRVFRHLTHEQRTTVLTMIVVHLDQLDVVRGAAQGGSSGSETLLNAALRENIELFSVAVMGTMFNFMAEVGLDIVTGVLGIISSLNVDLIARTRIGASMLTMILSRAEILKQAGVPQGVLDTWVSTYNNFFNVLEPTLPRLFPGPVNSGQDIYVWQLLAALGIGANQDQQQRLVLGVKDRVMDTVAVSKSLPRDLAQSRLQAVNLFMRSIGLDVELLV